jgi:hypothetical protein
MKRSKFTEEQVTYALGQSESGMVVEDVCRSLGDFTGHLLHLEAEIRRTWS